LNDFSRKEFMRFGYSVHSCVGKRLAFNEMRIVVAEIAREFDVVLWESYNEELLESEWKDCFAVKLGHCG
jgi:cytochrome P450